MEKLLIKSNGQWDLVKSKEHPYEAARKALESQLKQHDKDAYVSHVDSKTNEETSKPTGHVHVRYQLPGGEGNDRVDRIMSTHTHDSDLVTHTGGHGPGKDEVTGVHKLKSFSKLEENPKLN